VTKHTNKLQTTKLLFRVVQVLNIIISVRTKLIAVFIGPAGMGIISLLNSAINIISGVSGLGIETSAVKPGKHKENDLSSVSTMVSTVKIGLGCILARYWRYFFSSWLSTITLEIQIILWLLSLSQLRFC
jgi:O-antigen/teichoic acid export membrane protein